MPRFFEVRNEAGSVLHRAGCPVVPSGMIDLGEFSTFRMALQVLRIGGNGAEACPRCIPQEAQRAHKRTGEKNQL